MTTEPQNQPQHVTSSGLSEMVDRLRQGLDALDALLEEAEEAAKALMKPRRKKTASDHADT